MNRFYQKETGSELENYLFKILYEDSKKKKKIANKYEFVRNKTQLYKIK